MVDPVLRNGYICSVPNCTKRVYKNRLYTVLSEEIKNKIKLEAVLKAEERRNFLKGMNEKNDSSCIELEKYRLDYLVELKKNRLFRAALQIKDDK